MMPEKKKNGIHNKATRSSVLDKIKQAMKNKPTASSLSRQGLSTEELNKIIAQLPEDKRKMMQPNPSRIVRNGRERRTVRPTLAFHKNLVPNDFHHEPIPAANYYVYPTPDWFNFQGKADVSIIIPLWKSETVIKDQIKSWDLSNDGLKKEIIYVDDGCPHNSKLAVIEAWKERHSVHVGKIICIPSNAGFGRACNAGAKEATGDYLIFLNSDTVTTPDWVKPMIDVFEDDEVGMVGNLQMKEGGQWDGTIDSAGSEWNWQTMHFEHIGRNVYHRQHIPSPWKLKDAPKDAVEFGEREMVTGCCFAIRSELFEYLGGFDHNYRIGYWEDADLCMRVREAGFKIMFTPKSVIWHKLSATGSGGHPFMNYNIHYFHNRWTNSGRLDDLVWVPRPGGKPIVTQILVRRFGANGDVYLATGILPALKEKHRHAKITFFTACKEVVFENPHVAKVTNNAADLNMSAFNMVINLDLAYEYHPNWSIIESYCRAAGVTVDNFKPWIRLGTTTYKLPDQYVVIHPRSNAHSGWVGKNWRKEKFKEIVERLQADKVFVVCVGMEGDWDVGADLDLRGKTKVPELSAIMSKAKFFIGADSFPMHVANHFDVPGLVFFGAVNPSRILQEGSSIQPMQAKLDCLGCHHTKPIPCVGTDSCNRGDLACETELSVDAFWDEMRKMMKKLKVFPSIRTNLPMIQ
jgi:GT2 family glycosyltransferase